MRPRHEMDIMATIVLFFLSSFLLFFPGLQTCLHALQVYRQDRAGHLGHDPRHMFDLNKDHACGKGTDSHRAMGIVTRAGARLQVVRPSLLILLLLLLLLCCFCCFFCFCCFCCFCCCSRCSLLFLLFFVVLDVLDVFDVLDVLDVRSCFYSCRCRCRCPCRCFCLCCCCCCCGCGRRRRHHHHYFYHYWH